MNPLVRKVIGEALPPNDQPHHGDYAAAERETKMRSTAFDKRFGNDMDVQLHRALNSQAVKDFDHQTDVQTTAERLRRKRLGLPARLSGLE